MSWTKKDIEKLNLRNNLHENVNRKTVLPKKYTENGKISVEKESIKTLLWVMHREGKIPEYCEEFQFHHTRLFRFDWAIPSLKIAIEFEGLMSKKSRHTTLKGYSEDTRKYNLAAIDGWKVLRYTVITYKELGNDLEILLKMKT